MKSRFKQLRYRLGIFTKAELEEAFDLGKQQGLQVHDKLVATLIEKGIKDLLPDNHA